MALNSLYPDGWFALGAAALKVSYFCISMCLVWRDFLSFCPKFLKLSAEI